MFALQQGHTSEVEEMPTMMGEVLNQKSLDVLARKISDVLVSSELQDSIVIDLTSDTDWVEDDKSKQERVHEVQSQCLQIWSEISFSSSTASKHALPYRGKSSGNILNQLSFTDFRMQQNLQSGQGAKEVIAFLLKSDVSPQELQGSSPDSICQLQRWIYAHKIPASTPAGGLAIVPETIVSAEVTLRAIVTLEEGRWINSEILNFYFVQHALCTGGCCDQFPVPLPGCVPQVFYTDTYFLPHVVVGKRRWRHHLGDYNFIVIPGFVNNNHYVTFVANLASHELVSFDSLGHTQDHIRELLRLWLVNETQGQSWTTKSADCPQQKNSDDCLVFALLWIILASGQTTGRLL